MRLPLVVPLERSRFLARLLCRGDVVALALRADGRLEIERRDGSREEAEVHSGTTILPRLIVLRYRCAGRLESLVLPTSATGVEAHRRLRVWLGARAAVSAAG